MPADLGTDECASLARLGSVHIYNHFIDSRRLGDPEREALALAIRKRFYCSALLLLALSVPGTHVHHEVHNPGRKLSRDEMAKRMNGKLPVPPIPAAS